MARFQQWRINDNFKIDKGNNRQFTKDETNIQFQGINISTPKHNVCHIENLK
jgi:hypothetical protein